jgi:N-acetylmuramoyl-L-alanine amidase
VRPGFRGHLALLLVLSSHVTVAGATTVEALRLWSGPEGTRVVLDLSAPTEHRLFALRNPDRIVVDLDDARLASSLGRPQSKGLVSAVRTGRRPGGDLRVVLDLKRAATPKSFLLAPKGPYGDRLVIDLTATSGKEVVKRVPRATAQHARDVVIAIDAGHGGEDPGASGPHGVREKDVVLQIARRLAAQVRREAGMRPLLTRDGDYFVSLRKRTAIARQAEADLFVSIHADSYRNRQARGATVYALSEKGASDEAARRLARRENAADLVGGVSLADKDQLLARVLLDLSQGAAISASMNVGQQVIRQLGRVTAMRKTRVQQAPFLVLKSPDIPSVLIETAYISNPREEAELRDSDYQLRLAQAIHAGLLDYFRDNAPPDSYLALNPPRSRAVPIHHVISRGETLSGIAARYHVNVSTLRHLNRIKGDMLRIGQVLTIPSG